MTLTAIVGALVALVARPAELQRTRDQDEIERLKRAQAKLVDRIETLELDNEGLTRELAAERNLLTHWIGEAARFARDAREQREQSSSALYAQYHTALRREMMPQHGLAQQLGQQPLQAYAQYNQQANQHLQQQQLAGAQNVFAGHCNCVPSRTQMFDAMIGQVDAMVEQLNNMQFPRRF